MFKVIVDVIDGDGDEEEKKRPQNRRYLDAVTKSKSASKKKDDSPGKLFLHDIPFQQGLVFFCKSIADGDRKNTQRTRRKKKKSWFTTLYQ